MQAFKVIFLVACLAGVATAASLSSNTMCEQCKQAAANMKTKIPQIEKTIMNGCNLIPFKEKREACIKGGKDLMNYLKNETPEQICQAINQCPRSPSLELAGPGQPMCALCEPCKQLAQMVKSGATQVRGQLKGLCKNCGAPENVKKCEQTIEKFVDHVEQKSPEELCAEIGLCKH